MTFRSIIHRSRAVHRAPRSAIRRSAFIFLFGLVISGVFAHATRADLCAGTSSVPLNSNQVSPLIQVAGTYTGSGGGSGVACFSTDSAAQEARDSREDGEALPRSLLKNIVSLQATDLAEEPDETLLDPSGYSSVNDYVSGALTHYLSGLSAGFTDRLRATMSQIRFSSPSELSGAGVAPIRDTGSIQNVNVLSGRCALVQVAARRFETSPDGTSRPVVHLDPDLYARLGMKNRTINPRDHFLNQAVIVMHEVIYLLGSELGQRDSREARRQTIVALSNRFYQSTQDEETWLRTLGVSQPGTFQAVMIHILYENGFSLAPMPDSALQNPSPNQRELIHAFLGHEGIDEEYVTKKLDADYARIPTGQQGVIQYVGDNPIYDAAARSKYDAPESFIEIAEEALRIHQINDFYGIFGRGPEARQNFTQVCALARQEAAAWSRAYLFHFNPADSEYHVQVYERARAYCNQHPNGLSP